jgi:DMSO/TMAO reductase YedYZ molybdopterin-dependent catalytic subunit
MKNIKRVLLYLLAASVLAGCLSGCRARVKADISAYGETPIEVSGLKEEDFIITASDLAELDCVTATTTGRSAKAGTVNAVGPLLGTFLADYGKTVDDFKKIRFIAADGYRTVLKGEYLTDYDQILSVAAGNEPLPAPEQPLRLVIPDAESSMWVYAVIRIEFVE